MVSKIDIHLHSIDKKIKFKKKTNINILHFIHVIIDPLQCTVAVSFSCQKIKKKFKLQKKKQINFQSSKR
jgi:hypothetical protein